MIIRKNLSLDNEYIAIDSSSDKILETLAIFNKSGPSTVHSHLGRVIQFKRASATAG